MINQNNNNSLRMNQNQVDAINQKARCRELTLKAEPLIHSSDNNDRLKAIDLLQEALKIGTDDLYNLACIYSQLGNAFFLTQNLERSAEYHRYDFGLARYVGDGANEAKSACNLGNVLKAMGKFDEAIVCCSKALNYYENQETNEESVKDGKYRSYFSLGSIYYQKGRHEGKLLVTTQNDDVNYPDEAKKSFSEAVRYFKLALSIVEAGGHSKRKDVGRIVGNLGNIYYLLGNTVEALEFHKKRLNIAREYGDRDAMRRAYANIGNTLTMSGEFNKAIVNYQVALRISMERLDDNKIESAQMLYALGNLHTIIKDFPIAIIYYKHHLAVARNIGDQVGESRCYWSLANVYQAMDDKKKALYYMLCHHQVSKLIGDATAVENAERNLLEIFGLDFENPQIPGENELVQLVPDASDDYDQPVAESFIKIPIRDIIVEIIERHQKVAESQTSDDSEDGGLSRKMNLLTEEAASVAPVRRYDSMERMQRIDSCSNLRNDRPSSAIDFTEDQKALHQHENMLDMILRLNAKRLDDQRANPGFNGHSPTTHQRQSDSLYPRAHLRSTDLRSPVTYAKEAGTEIRNVTALSNLSLAGESFNETSSSKSILMSDDCTLPSLSKLPHQTPFVRRSIYPVTSGDKPDNALSIEDQVFIDSNPTQPQFLDNIRVDPQSSPSPAISANNFEQQHRITRVSLCAFLALSDLPQIDPTSAASINAFFDILAGLQSRRMNDQRADLPDLPGLNKTGRKMLDNKRHSIATAASQESNDIPPENIIPSTSSASTHSVTNTQQQRRRQNKSITFDSEVEELFELLAHNHSRTRIESQRTALPDKKNSQDQSTSSKTSSATANFPDMFDLIERNNMRSIDDQRSFISTPQKDATPKSKGSKK